MIKLNLMTNGPKILHKKEPVLPLIGGEKKVVSRKKDSGPAPPAVPAKRYVRSI
jgi:hypothetical protein